MSNVVGIKIVTGTLFFATAVGAPVAAWLSNQPFEPAHQLAALSEGNFEVQPPDDWLRLEPGEVVELIQVDRVIISAALQTKSERAKAKKDCYDHYSQKLATGKVRICDVARSSNASPPPPQGNNAVLEGPWVTPPVSRR